MNSIRHVRSSVLSPIRRPIRCNAWREAASVSKCATDVDAPQRCERYVLEVQSYSRNIGWSVINRNDLSRLRFRNRLVIEAWLGARLRQRRGRAREHPIKGKHPDVGEGRSWGGPGDRGQRPSAPPPLSLRSPQTCEGTSLRRRGLECTPSCRVRRSRPRRCLIARRDVRQRWLTHEG